jgi:hypothetical protein
MFSGLKPKQPAENMATIYATSETQDNTRNGKKCGKNVGKICQALIHAVDACKSIVVAQGANLLATVGNNWQRMARATWLDAQRFWAKISRSCEKPLFYRGFPHVIRPSFRSVCGPDSGFLSCYRSLCGML